MSDAEESEKECPVCWDTKSLLALGPCEHECCQSCLEGWIEHRINTSSDKTIPCPCDDDGDHDSAHCGTLLDAALVQRVAGAALWERYQKVAGFTPLQPDERECPKCSTTCKHAPGQGSDMRCEVCGVSFCFYHSSAHPDSTCEEYEKRTGGEVPGSKPCPACGVRIVRDKGCAHIKCVCGAHFCWHCGEVLQGRLYANHFAGSSVSGCRNSNPRFHVQRCCMLVLVAPLVFALLILPFGLLWISCCIFPIACMLPIPLFQRGRQRWELLSALATTLCLPILVFGLWFGCLDPADITLAPRREDAPEPDLEAGR